MKRRYVSKPMEAWEQKMYEEMLQEQIDEQRWYAIVVFKRLGMEMIVPIQ